MTTITTLACDPRVAEAEADAIAAIAVFEDTMARAAETIAVMASTEVNRANALGTPEAAEAAVAALRQLVATTNHASKTFEELAEPARALRHVFGDDQPVEVEPTA